MVPRSMVFQAWAALEETATVLSVPLLTPDDLARARRANRRLAEQCAARDLANYRTTAIEVHDILYSRCPNHRLLTLTRAESRYLRGHGGVRPSVSWDTARDAVWEHDMLIDLIATRADPGEITSYARSHRMRMVESVQQEEAAAQDLVRAHRGPESAL